MYKCFLFVFLELANTPLHSGESNWYRGAERGSSDSWHRQSGFAVSLVVNKWGLNVMWPIILLGGSSILQCLPVIGRYKRPAKAAEETHLRPVRAVPLGMLATSPPPHPPLQ